MPDDLLDVTERAIAVVVKEPTRHRSVEARDAILRCAARTAWAILAFIEINEAADEEIEAAVVVIVKPDCTRSPSRSGNPGRLRYVGESTISVVVVQNAPAVLGDVEIREAIAVIVADCHPLPVSAAGHSGFLGDVGEGAVAIVVVQRIAQGRVRI